MKKLVFATAFLAIVACKENTKTSETVSTEPETTTTTDNTSGVTIEENKPVEPTVINSIQKKSLNELDINVTKARVTGDILTVELMVINKGTERISYYLPLDEVSYIDDATSKKYSLLKDDAGKYMANPINSTNKDISIFGTEKEHLITMKFPAPPAESKTISLNIPKFGSFDVLPITR